jgi:hypothetical protein
LVRWIVGKRERNGRREWKKGQFEEGDCRKGRREWSKEVGRNVGT